MDTIAAISTGNTLSAIGILRVSGEDCFAVCDKVFRALNSKPFQDLPPREMVLGNLLDAEGRTVDQVLAVRFPAPHSYTGEDCAEFHCHGSPVVLSEGLRGLFAAGARQAERGEFTKRAFLSGSLDLTQAEAVVDLIEAETASAARNAAAQLDGALRRRLEPVQDTLLDIAARFYAVVDYPDEDIGDAGPEEISAALRQAEAHLAALLDTCRRGQVLKKGVRTAIVGAPNAGKSSLLNALAGYERAIVTEFPGTTRDTVEESVLCGSVLLRLIDTAGIRNTNDPVEQKGVERSRKAMENAGLILLLEDGTMEAPADPALLEAVAQTGTPWIYIATKRDLSGYTSIRACSLDGHISPAASLSLSALTGEGLEDLEHAVASLFPAGNPQEAGSLLTDQRQEEAAKRALASVRRAREALASGMTADAVLTDAETALNALGELTGRTLREDLVARIFERFCVGK